VNVKRMMKRASVAILALAGVAVSSGASWEMVMRRRTERSISMPGRLLDVGGGRRLQLDCRGAGAPTVVLESGLDSYGSLAWASVHDSIARTTRVCAYSRAGIMWSDAATGELDARTVARDLHAALAGGGESMPVVMVGHSLGGPYVMTFTGLYGRDVAGMVLVDATHPDQFARFREATGKDLMPAPDVVRLGAALAWTGLVRALPSEPTPAGWPSEVGRVSQAHLSKSVHGVLRDVEGVPRTLAIAGTYRSLGNRPTVVLTAGKPKSAEEIRRLGITADDVVRLAAAARALQDDEATWSRRSRHEVVPDASHYIQFDRPDAVIRAVREVVDAVRGARP
jgi:pimeloyl-ACP methyl ester carboxylesterase